MTGDLHEDISINALKTNALYPYRNLIECDVPFL